MSGSLESPASILLALLFFLVVFIQTILRHIRFYKSAPLELRAFIEVCRSSVSENECCDTIIHRIPRLDDKIRLIAIYRDIKRCGDNLRETINGLVCDDFMNGDYDDNNSPRLHVRARLLWIEKRAILENFARRLDMLRMRFFILHFGTVSLHKSSATLPTAICHQVALPRKENASSFYGKSLNKSVPPSRPSKMHQALTSEILNHALLSGRKTQAASHIEQVEHIQKGGWLGVVDELQRSPKMKLRHANIESAMLRNRSSRSVTTPASLSAVSIKEKNVVLPAW